MDSTEQERQGEEGKKNPTKQKQTAHTSTEKGREGIRAVTLAADFGQRGHSAGPGTAYRTAEDGGPIINMQPSSKEAAE